jgi:hypothetical protein
LGLSFNGSHGISHGNFNNLVLVCSTFLPNSLVRITEDLTPKSFFCRNKALSILRELATRRLRIKNASCGKFPIPVRPGLGGYKINSSRFVDAGLGRGLAISWIDFELCFLPKAEGFRGRIAISKTAESGYVGALDWIAKR